MVLDLDVLVFLEAFFFHKLGGMLRDPKRRVVFGQFWECPYCVCGQELVLPAYLLSDQNVEDVVLQLEKKAI